MPGHPYRKLHQSTTHLGGKLRLRIICSSGEFKALLEFELTTPGSKPNPCLLNNQDAFDTHRWRGGASTKADP